MLGTTEKIKFKAHKKVKKPTGVSFKTADGEKVRFTAKKTVKGSNNSELQSKKEKLKTALRRQA